MSTTQTVSSGDTAHFRQPRAHSIWIGLALTSIVLANVLASLHWINRNVVLVGHDSAGYLSTALIYNALLSNLSLQTLFQAFTFTDYRAPGLFIAVQPFFRLFGVDMDSAQLFNIVVLAFLVWATYALGQSVSGIGVGLYSALLIGLLPMIAAMSRLFYTELALTAMVTLNLLAMLRSHGFRVRGWSIVWGISLGLGMLVKWALPIYLLLPILWTLWREGIVAEHIAQWRRWRINFRALTIGAVVGLLFTMLWAWPNRAEFDRFVLGNLLFFGWFAIVALWVYAILQPRSIISNFWLGVLTAGVIASLWYLPYLDFAAKVLVQDQERGNPNASLWNPYNYYRDLSVLYNSHFGRLAAWLLLPIGLFPWARALWTQTPIQARSAPLWTCLLSTYLILALLAQDSPRFLVPVLPAALVLLVVGLWQYRRGTRLVLACLWVLVLGLQWSVFTFDSLNPVYARTERFWVGRFYAIPPNSYETDIGYWIGPALLDHVAGDSVENQRLGMLVNSHQLHRGMLKYLIEAEGRPVTIIDLTEADSQAWYDLISSQWVLVKDGDNHNVEAPGQVVIERIYGDDPLFHELHELVEQYPLPNGETASLYRRVKGPGRPKDLPLLLAQTEPVADEIARAWSSHASLVYADSDLAVWVGIHDPAAKRVHVLNEEKDQTLSTLSDTVLVVWSHESDSVQAWFDAHAYRTYEVGDDFASVAIYGLPTEPLQAVEVEAVWPDVVLSDLQSWPVVAAGQVLPVSTQWASGIGKNLKVSTRLVDGEGKSVASHDRPLVQSDRYGLFVPPGTSTGPYTLIATLYDPTNMETISAADGENEIVLTTVQIEN